MKIARYRVLEEEACIPEKLNGFRDWEFSNGSTTGADFQVFARLFKACIKKSLPPDAQLVEFHKGHYYLSGFIQRGDRFVYFSISDVRHFPNAWHSNILIRTAKSAKDYTGGSNGYTTLERFSEDAERLLEGRHLSKQLL